MASIINSTTTAGVTVTGDNSGSLQLATNNGTTAVTIDTSQKVGISTTSPDSKLHVKSTVDNTTNGLTLEYDTGTAYKSRVFTRGNDLYLSADTGNTGGGIFFQTAGGTDRAYITSGGNFQFNSGYGSVATAYGCRAWVNFNGAGTPAIRASGNVTSITDNGTGDYTINFTTAMPNTNYCNVFTAGRGDSNDVRVAQPTNPLVGSLQFVTRAGTQGASTNAKEDMENIFVAVFR